MIYCVVPEALAGELYDKLVEYYVDDGNVTVIVDRRQSERRARGSDESAETEQQRQVRDRRRARVPGEFPDVDSPVSDDTAA
jgi:hypothetical protein